MEPPSNNLQAAEGQQQELFDWEKEDATDTWLDEIAENNKKVVSVLKPMKVRFDPRPTDQPSADGETREKMISESDKLLFNPCEDELNQQWVYDQLL